MGIPRQDMFTMLILYIPTFLSILIARMEMIPSLSFLHTQFPEVVSLHSIQATPVYFMDAEDFHLDPMDLMAQSLEFTHQDSTQFTLDMDPSTPHTTLSTRVLFHQRQSWHNQLTKSRVDFQ